MEAKPPVTKCAQCSSVLDEEPNIPVGQRTPCRNCGSTSRRYEVEIAETVTLRTSLGMKARHGTGGRPFYQAKSGADLHRATGRWLERELVIDRQNDRYAENVIDPQTGEVVHVCEEPLSPTSRSRNGEEKIPFRC
jgi:hypothetical protein